MLFIKRKSPIFILFVGSQGGTKQQTHRSAAQRACHFWSVSGEGGIITRRSRLRCPFLALGFQALVGMPRFFSNMKTLLRNPKNVRVRTGFFFRTGNTPVDGFKTGNARILQ